MRSDFSTSMKMDAPLAVTQDLGPDTIEPGTEKRVSSAVTKSPLRMRKFRNLDPERAHEALSSAHTVNGVRLFLKDGRIIDGAILFNEFKRTGRIINIHTEISVDFHAEEVRDLWIPEKRRAKPAPVA